jgi:cytochrome P450
MGSDPLDLFTTAATLDPHPVQARLRAESPVHHHPSMDAWTIARHRDVVEVMRDARRFSSALGMGELMAGRIRPDDPPRPQADFAGTMRMVIAADPPDHTTLRRLVSAPFGPREVAKLEPRIRSLCESLVDDLMSATEPDLVQHVAWPLPVIVIAEVLGIPIDRREDFKRWSTDMVGGLAGELDLERSQQSAFEMFSFFVEAIAAREVLPGDDAISFLLSKSNVLQGEDRLTVPDLVGFCVLLLIAGNETTTNLVGNAAHAFFDHPGEWEKLVADPSLAPSAVEECLRYDGPVKTIFRMNAEEVTVAGTTIPPMSRVLPLFSSANRDESIWPDADVFRVDRNPQEHVAFGYGIHHCLGAPLARLEARILFETLAARRLVLTSRGDGVPVNGPILRGWQSVPVTVDDL